MPDVVLIRPGCTNFDEQNRIQGSLDLPLSPRGQEQVTLLVEELRAIPLDVVFSAPCEPARSTAIAICEACGVAHKELDGFRNLDHGLWQGLQVDDVRRKFPKVFKQWQESPETVCLPEGETVAEAIERIARALRKCLKRKKTVGIVASEPLATLIGCVLRGLRPELPESAAADQPASRFEILHLSDEAAQQPGRVPAPVNGVDQNGKNGTKIKHGSESKNGTTIKNGAGNSNGAGNQIGTGNKNGNGHAVHNEQVPLGGSGQAPPQGVPK